LTPGIGWRGGIAWGAGGAMKYLDKESFARNESRTKRRRYVLQTKRALLQTQAAGQSKLTR